MFDHKDCKDHHHGGTSNSVYGMGFIGALVFYIQHAANIQEVLLGILKAAIWPAIFVYRAIEMFRI